MALRDPMTLFATNIVKTLDFTIEYAFQFEAYI